MFVETVGQMLNELAGTIARVFMRACLEDPFCDGKLSECMLVVVQCSSWLTDVDIRQGMRVREERDRKQNACRKWTLKIPSGYRNCSGPELERVI